MREQFDAMIRLEVAPWFRAGGFRKARNVFTRVDGEAWQRVGFQASAWGSRDEVRFTINLSVGLRSLAGDDAVVGVRIGSLLRGDQDRDLWWDVDRATDLPSLAAELRAILQDVAHPWLAERTGLEALMAKATSDPVGFPGYSLGRLRALLERAELTDQAEIIAGVITTLPPPPPKYFTPSSPTPGAVGGADGG